MEHKGDFISALRYTVKGPNSLGSGKAERNIGIKYRGTHPSYIGSIDINVYSSSSPGLNGSLSPFAHTTGLYFNPDPEPQDKEYLIYKDIVEESKKSGDAVVEMGHDSLSYYDAMMKSKQRLHDNFKVSKKRNPNLIYIKIDNDNDRMI